MSTPSSSRGRNRERASTHHRTDPPTLETSGADPNYEKLRGAIVRGEIAPNAHLVESDISSSFEMSRGAVRNALIRLEQEGLVVREPHRGARVRQVGDREAIEILQARAVLEGLAVRMTAERIDEAGAERLRECLAHHRQLLDSGDLLGASDANAELHAALLELSGHSTVQRLIRGLSAQMVRYQYRTILIPGRPAASQAEHAAIVEAVVARSRSGPRKQCAAICSTSQKRSSADCFAASTVTSRGRDPGRWVRNVSHGNRLVETAAAGECPRTMRFGAREGQRESQEPGGPARLGREPGRHAAQRFRRTERLPRSPGGVHATGATSKTAWQKTCVLYNQSYHMADLAVEGPDARGSSRTRSQQLRRLRRRQGQALRALYT